MTTNSTATTEAPESTPRERFHILSLDGGGAKGFYTLGVLREIEGELGSELCNHFDLVFGTSTGAIIAALIALGYKVDDIHALYREHVPSVMKKLLPRQKSKALAKLAEEVFGDKQFTDFKTKVGIVATKWDLETPMIFKNDVAQAHGRKGTFVPGFGASVAVAVQASCSAYPAFKLMTVTTAVGNKEVLVGDGGYCANNPTLYAIAEATGPLKQPQESLRVVSVGVGRYPAPKYNRRQLRRYANLLPSFQLLQKSLEINTQSMDQLRMILFKNVRTVRISDAFEKPEMATDLLEHDRKKLNLLYQQGGESYGRREVEIRDCLSS
jgi:uncharacterized protein